MSFWMYSYNIQIRILRMHVIRFWLKAILKTMFIVYCVSRFVLVVKLLFLLQLLNYLYYVLMSLYELYVKMVNN